MTNSRRKGQRGQVEAAHKLNGKVIARAGVPGPDVLSPPIATLHPPLARWEIKRPGKLSAELRSWINQASREGADAVMFREDRGKWFVLIPFDRIDA